VAYWISSIVIRVILSLTMRIRTKGLSAAARPGGYLLACGHVSHLDPFCLGGLLRRRVGWMARIEFFRQSWAAPLLRVAHAFPVNRQGVPVRAIRTALARLARGEVVGMFPEGEIKTGSASALRGAPIKRGVCLLAARSGRPVLPCVILGADKLNALDPWLPMLRGRLWVACGELIEPTGDLAGKRLSGHDRRAARAEMAARIEKALAALYADLRREYGLDDTILP
jgi:1-acyl-sn-glycerol-3-phosphate acyltransferase